MRGPGGHGGWRGERLGGAVQRPPGEGEGGAQVVDLGGEEVVRVGATTWMAEYKAGLPKYNEYKKADTEHLL
ncbi:hypothetical protein ABZ128_29570, partial [Streptomyces sp. NPDC006326]|uniref:hypothetical protein n=1 Tax=Streptomyces sp. NPDC006326 TaxID=3156752 RepID=UPI0033B971B9